MADISMVMTLSNFSTLCLDKFYNSYAKYYKTVYYRRFHTILQAMSKSNRRERMDPYESVEKRMKKTCQLYDYTYLSLVVLTFPGVASYAIIWIFDIEGKNVSVYAVCS